MSEMPCRALRICETGDVVEYPLLAACASMPSSGVPVSAEWGGEHVRLSLTPAGGTLEYDCAARTISGPVTLRRDLTFTAPGTHTPGSGGPDVPGRVMPTFRVRFSGSVRGDVLRLQGRVEEGVLLGPFKLRRGAEPVIFRCL